MLDLLHGGHLLENGLDSGKKKAHKHKLSCPVGLGTTPGLSRGFHRVCPWDKFAENLGQTRVFSLFTQWKPRFHRVCARDKPGLSLGQSWGRRAAQRVYVKKTYVPFSLAIDRPENCDVDMVLPVFQHFHGVDGARVSL